jgi:signal transduction histidine kinase
VKYHISQLIDLARLQHLMDALFRATGINHALIDIDSNVLTAAGWEEVCTKFHRTCPGTLVRCQDSDRYIAGHLSDGPYVGYRCPNGLVDYATPVVIEGEHVANVFTGQMFHEPPDLDFFRRQAAEFGFDEAEYLEAVQRVRIVPVERMDAIMTFLAGLAGMLADSGIARLRQMDAELEMQQLNAELAGRVEERTAALARLTEELQRSNTDLEQFAYAVSHDLQEPLRMVHSYMQLIERRLRGQLDAEAVEYINFAVEGADRMNALIHGLLDYSRVTRHGGEPRPTDMNQVVTAALDDLRLAVADAGAEMQVESLPTVHGDAEQLIRLMENLIGNALKYRTEGRPPVIAISAFGRDGEWRFAVKDNGIGIDSRHFDRIFGVFQRLHSRAQYAGTGIGLALCKRIVERHGGRIWVESTPGDGSTFFFTLPAG